MTARTAMTAMTAIIAIIAMTAMTAPTQNSHLKKNFQKIKTEKFLQTENARPAGSTRN